MKILSAKQIKRVDTETILKDGISSLELMERAATSFCNWFFAKYTNKQLSIIIFAGVGNNGGDALVVARVLHNQGYNVTVCIIEYSENYTDDCAHNLRKVKAEKISCKKVSDRPDIPDLNN